MTCPGPTELAIETDHLEFAYMSGNWPLLLIFYSGGIVIVFRKNHNKKREVALEESDGDNSPTLCAIIEYS